MLDEENNNGGDPKHGDNVPVLFIEHDGNA